MPAVLHGRLQRHLLLQPPGRAATGWSELSGLSEARRRFVQLQPLYQCGLSSAKTENIFDLSVQASAPSRSAKAASEPQTLSTWTPTPNRQSPPVVAWPTLSKSKTWQVLTLANDISPSKYIYSPFKVPVPAATTSVGPMRCGAIFSSLAGEETPGVLEGEFAWTRNAENWSNPSPLLPEAAATTGGHFNIGYFVDELPNNVDTTGFSLRYNQVPCWRLWERRSQTKRDHDDLIL